MYVNLIILTNVTVVRTIDGKPEDDHGMALEEAQYREIGADRQINRLCLEQDQS